MREIKFRLYFNKINEGVINIDPRNCGCGWIQSDDLEFMQYTGLKDKNGVEIYEGDIVRYCQKSYHMNTDGFGRHLDIDVSNSFSTNIRTAVVTYMPERAEYRMVDIGSSNSRNLYELPLEVIGNKFENAELLIPDWIMQ